MLNTLLTNCILVGGSALITFVIIAILLSKDAVKLAGKIIVVYTLILLLVLTAGGIKIALPAAVVGQVPTRTQIHIPPVSPSEVVEAPFAESEGESSPSIPEEANSEETSGEEATQASTVSEEEIQEGGTPSTENRDNEYDQNRGRGAWRFR